MVEIALPVDPARFEAIMRDAGAMALADFRDDAAAATRSWAKQGGSPVSDADLAVDNFLRDRLGELLPEAGWLSEETADNPARLDRSHVWIVDPIDGTRAFLGGRPGWCVSVALVENGCPVLAALHAPKHDAYYEAQAGGGAQRNGMPIRVSARGKLAGARKPAHNLAKGERELVAVPCPNSIALRLAMVASGSADIAYTTRWGAEWDIAAAWLIVKEAGGAMTDIAGNEIAFNKPDPRLLGILASAPGIYGEMREKLVPHLPGILEQVDPERRG